MADDYSNSQYDWWKNLQQLDMTEVRLLIDVHPHLVWSRMMDPGFRPTGGDAFLTAFGGDLVPVLMISIRYTGYYFIISLILMSKPWYWTCSTKPLRTNLSAMKNGEATETLYCI
ncbi:unnamed protein product [Absidia cylindrospora]